MLYAVLAVYRFWAVYTLNNIVILSSVYYAVKTRNLFLNLYRQFQIIKLILYIKITEPTLNLFAPSLIVPIHPFSAGLLL
jgi:hypothetical protein